MELSLPNIHFRVDELRGLPRPLKYTIVTSSAEGRAELTAFDLCLLKAGVGNVNLLKVSSILPPSAIYCEEVEPLEPGSLLPIAYGSKTSSNPGELMAAAVGIGIHSEDGYGVIMEYAGLCSEREAEEKVESMIIEAFENRGLSLKRLMIKGIEHRVLNIGAVFAAVPLWY
ncbi:MAG: arginine decarboxylase, pyruvoyl-dependent [Nitrospirae bacterium]|nr:MAG: arginine decarboxylase, pyruvoyl-dependent [Nitrospirota bacterium]